MNTSSCAVACGIPASMYTFHWPAIVRASSIAPACIWSMLASSAGVKADSVTASPSTGYGAGTGHPGNATAPTPEAGETERAGGAAQSPAHHVIVGAGMVLVPDMPEVMVCGGDPVTHGDTTGRLR